MNEVYLNGLKKYLLVGKTVESSYIQIKDTKSKNNEIKKIIDLADNYRKDKQIDYFVFIVYDMDKFETCTYTLSDNGIEIENYDKYTSRGNVIIPKLKEKLENILIYKKQKN